MFFVETAAAALSLGATAVENRGKIARLRQNIHDRWQQRRIIMLIYGAGGVGKTTLGELLVGDLHADRASSQYETSLKIEKYRVPGDIASVAWVAPGQTIFRDDQWPDMHSLITGGKVAGLINVVGWGYESLEVSYKDTKLFRDNPTWTSEEFLAAYLEERRRAETAVIETLAGILKNTKRRLWMLTLVTKQDLWWDRRQEVQAHYEQGAYNTHIEDIVRVRGLQNFRHEYRSASLIISNFATAPGEVLALTVGGYDQLLQADNQHHLLRILEALFQW